MRAMNRSAFALRETSRRLLSLGVVSLALASPWALAREGVDVSKQHSGFARLVPADQVEAAAQQQFAQPQPDEQHNGCSRATRRHDRRQACAQAPTGAMGQDQQVGRPRADTGHQGKQNEGQQRLRHGSWAP